jgi:hypothetical protein
VKKRIKIDKQVPLASGRNYKAINRYSKLAKEMHPGDSILVPLARRDAVIKTIKRRGLKAISRIQTDRKFCRVWAAEEE